MSDETRPRRAMVWCAAHGLAAAALLVLASVLFVGLPIRADQATEVAPFQSPPLAHTSQPSDG